MSLLSWLFPKKEEPVYEISSRIPDDFFEKVKRERDQWQRDYEMDGYTAESMFDKALLNWISECSDSMVLAKTAHSINCGQWPSNLPKYPSFEGIEGTVENQYRCQVITLLKDKAEAISPGLYQKVWMSKEYQDSNW